MGGDHRAELLLRLDQIWPARFERHHTIKVFSLFLAQIPAQCREVMIETRRQLLARGPCFFDDWIFPH